MKKKFTVKLGKKSVDIKVQDIFEITIFIVVLFMATFGTFFILRCALHTKTPMVVVTSGSMDPTLRKGYLLFLKGVDPADIEAGDHEDRTGDIIVFEADWSSTGDPIVHRVVDKELVNVSGTMKWRFRTWGDNNNYADSSWAWEEDVIGIVVGKIPLIGYIKIWLSLPGAAIIVVIGLAFILIISIAYDITHPEKEKDKKPRKRLFSRRSEEFDDENDDLYEDDENESEVSSVDLGV